MFIPINGGQGISRPFVVGLILLLVFLGLQSDLVPSKQPESENTPQASNKASAKERIILELSKSNEKLERELHQLQQQLLLVKHAAHQQGINHDSPVGAVLYAEDLDSIFEGNMTIANSTADAGMMQNGEHEDDLTVHHATQSEVSSRAASRRELPARTHHHQTVENP